MESLSFDRLPTAVNQILEKQNRLENLLMKLVEQPKQKPERFGFNGLLDYLRKQLTLPE